MFTLYLLNFDTDFILFNDLRRVLYSELIKLEFALSRFLFKFALLITLVLTITSLAARAFGSSQPFNPTMREFADGCAEQPCWQGVVPGETTLAEAKNLLVGKGYKVLSVTSVQLAVSKPNEACQQSLTLSGGIIRQINLTFCQPMRLGDFMGQNRHPDTVMLDPLSIWYQGQMQILFVPQFASWDTLSYFTPLREVILFPADSPLPYQRAAWLDLLTQRKYCQLKGLQYHCAH